MRMSLIVLFPFSILLKGVGYLEAEDVERRPIPRAVADGMKDHEIEIADKGVVGRNGMEGEPDLRAGGVEHVRTADAGLVGEEQLLAGVWRYLEVGYAPARADAKALPIAHVWLDEPLVAVLETRAEVKAERPEFRRGETQFEGGTLLGVKFIVNAFAYDPVPERQHEVRAELVSGEKIAFLVHELCIVELNLLVEVEQPVWADLVVHARIEPFLVGPCERTCRQRQRRRHQIETEERLGQT